jgi:hypothetical protein
MMKLATEYLSIEIISANFELLSSSRLDQPRLRIKLEFENKRGEGDACLLSNSHQDSRKDTSSSNRKDKENKNAIQCVEATEASTLLLPSTA